MRRHSNKTNLTAQRSTSSFAENRRAGVRNVPVIYSTERPVLYPFLLIQRTAYLGKCLSPRLIKPGKWNCLSLSSHLYLCYAASMDSHQDDLPPHYDDLSTQLPPTFHVANEDISPLVTITDVEAHLRLLSAFAKLNQDVQSACPSSAVSDRQNENMSENCPTDPNRAWVVFVNRAVHRFNLFMSGNSSGEAPVWSEAVIPPLDVIMVWHAYLLVCPPVISFTCATHLDRIRGYTTTIVFDARLCLHVD